MEQTTPLIAGKLQSDSNIAQEAFREKLHSQGYRDTNLFRKLQRDDSQDYQASLDAQRKERWDILYMFNKTDDVLDNFNKSSDFANFGLDLFDVIAASILFTRMVGGINLVTVLAATMCRSYWYENREKPYKGNNWDSTLLEASWLDNFSSYIRAIYSTLLLIAWCCCYTIKKDGDHDDFFFITVSLIANIIPGPVSQVILLIGIWKENWVNNNFQNRMDEIEGIVNVIIVFVGCATSKEIFIMIVGYVEIALFVIIYSIQLCGKDDEGARKCYIQRCLISQPQFITWLIGAFVVSEQSDQWICCFLAVWTLSYAFSSFKTSELKGYYVKASEKTLEWNELKNECPCEALRSAPDLLFVKENGEFTVKNEVAVQENYIRLEKKVQENHNTFATHVYSRK